MTKQARNELVVGLVFFGALTFLGVYTIVISGLFEGSTKTFLVSFPRIYGLKDGDSVRVEGLEKGKVTDLALTETDKGDQRVKAKLVVAGDVDIYKDGGEVKVTPFSPLGGRIVEIKRGVDTRGKYVSVEEAKGDKKADMIQGTAEGELLQTLNDVVDENRKGIAQIVSNLSFVSERLTKSDNVLGALINDTGTGSLLKDTANELAHASLHLDSILRRIDRGQGVLGELTVAKSDLHDNLNGAVANAKASLHEANVLLANANDGRSPLGVIVSDKDPSITADAKQIVHDIATVTSDVAGGKGTIGQLVTDRKLYDDAAATAENLSKIMKAVTEKKSAAGVLLYDENTGEHLRSTLAHLDGITASVDNADGALGLLVKDRDFRDRVGRIVQEVERLAVEFRDSIEDVREQAPINAFLGAVFSAF